MEIPDLRVCQEGPGVVPRCLVRGPHPNGLIPLLEVIRGADHLLVECLIEASLDSC